MKLRFSILSILLFLFFTSCSNNSPLAGDVMNAQDSLKQAVTNTEALIYQSVEADDSVAKDMIEKYISYVDAYPQDSIAPEYLFRAAEIAMNFKQPHNAIRFLTKIENDYPSFEKLATCAFLKAFICDNYTKNPKKAKEYYTYYIDSFPNHHFIEDAKAALIYINLSDEDIITIFEEENK